MKTFLHRFMIVLMFLVVAIQNAKAESYLGYGLGIASSAKDSVAECKFFNLGYREDLILGFSHQYELGFFTDSVGNGRVGSAIGAYMIGIEVNPLPIVLRSMSGVGFISEPDIYLGGHFQFHHDLYVGMKDSFGKSLGINYRHISSAGLYQPNLGRDFVSIQLGIPW